MNARAQRMSNQVTDAPETSRSRYLIQVMHKRDKYWYTVGVPGYDTPEAAKRAALNSSNSPVSPGNKWRIIRETSTWTTVDTSGI